MNCRAEVVTVAGRWMSGVSSIVRREAVRPSDREYAFIVLLLVRQVHRQGLFVEEAPQKHPRLKLCGKLSDRSFA